MARSTTRGARVNVKTRESCYSEALGEKPWHGYEGLRPCEETKDRDDTEMELESPW